ncbi:YdeI/OmpD-associated family protein [Acholeplasma sp. OttesenSCG-928-E16]|nr:YdeI/OmpD-associated family protein [Acholeplasma sp. OttesenSCG-928-E16]
MTKIEMTFSNRKEYRDWLSTNAETSDGFWMIFEKGKSLSPNDALEEALCFGWIDGLMKNISPGKYKKYFAKRTIKSKWSKKNKELANELIAKGVMTNLGFEAIEVAKKNGMWNTVQKNEITDDQKNKLIELISVNSVALENFKKMSPSIQKNYVLMYFDAKTETTKIARLEKIISRLESNLKPM